jgi:hypothetical protein
MSTTDNIFLLALLAVIALLIYLQGSQDRKAKTVVCDYCAKRRRKIDCITDEAGYDVCATCQEQQSS